MRGWLKFSFMGQNSVTLKQPKYSLFGYTTFLSTLLWIISEKTILFSHYLDLKILSAVVIIEKVLLSELQPKHNLCLPLVTVATNCSM